jgi:chromosome partitioning protein
MSKIVAFVNMKGGVGKTTVAVSMAEASAAAGRRTLLLGLDLQINASVTLVGNCTDDFLPWNRHSTVEDVLENIWQRRDIGVPNFITRFGLVYLLSGSPSITLFERRLLTVQQNYFQARNTADSWVDHILRQARRTFDLVICDTPPGLSLLSEAVIRRADLIVIPQVPDRLSTQGMQLYAHYLNHDLQVPDMHRTAVFLNKRGQNGVSRDYVDRIRQDAGSPRFPYKVFKNFYANCVAFKRAMDRSEVDPRQSSFDGLWGPVANDVKAATQELWELLGLYDESDKDDDDDQNDRRQASRPRTATDGQLPLF